MSMHSSGQMSGTYMIGTSTSDDFSSFTEAIDSLESQGINGSVLFRIKAGTYNEQVTIHEITGASATNRITFESYDKDSNSVILTYSPASGLNNFTMNFAGADFFTFKEMTISSGGTSYARVILIAYGSTDNQFISNRIIGRTPPILNFAFSSDFSLVYSSNAFTVNDHNNLFRNNIFKYGLIALDYHGSNSGDEKGTIIENNLFLNQYSTAITISNQEDVIIRNNVIENRRNEYFSAIILNYCSGQFQILSNKINIPYCFSGIGVKIDNCKGYQAANALIANNFIRINCIDTINVFNFSQAALQLTFVENLAVHNNSLNVTGDYSLSKAIELFQSSKGTSIINNNVINDGGGICFSFNQHLDSLNIELNYNNYFSPKKYYTSSINNTLSINGFFHSLSDWQSITSFDSFSISVNPDFNSPSDLHSFSLLINGKGRKTLFVNADIDGDIRDTMSLDIGADEFSPYSLDKEIQLFSPEIGVNCNLYDSQHISIVIINKGVQIITNTQIEFKLPGIDSFTELISDTIHSLDSFYYTTSSFFNLSQKGHYFLEVSIIDTFDQNGNNNHISAYLQNLHSIQKFPFTEDFEQSYSDYFKLNHESQSRISIDKKAAYQGEYGLHCQGRALNVGWFGGATSTTAQQAWQLNSSHHTRTSSCLIDAQQQTHLRLCFRIRLSYSYGLKYNWFRLLINDSIPWQDMNGRTDFNPTTNKDTFILLTYDLTQFCGSQFYLTFQTSSLVQDKYYNEGDNVFIDEIRIFNPAETDVGVINILSPYKPLCGDQHTEVKVELKNYGYAAQTNIPVFVEVETPLGSFVLSDTFKKTLLPNTTDTLLIGYVSTSKEGLYYFKSFTAFNEDSICRLNDTFHYQLKFLNAIEIPVIECFDGPDSLSKWKIKNMWVSYPGAHNVNSSTLSNSIWAIDSVAFADLNRKFGPITKQSHLLFEYRIVRNSYPFGAMTIGGHDSLLFLISSNCGISFDTLIVIDSLNHIPTTEMKSVQLPLKAYIGEYLNLTIKIVSDSLNVNYYDLDSIVIADLPKSHFLADTASCPGDSVLITFSPEPNQNYIWQMLGKKDTLSFSHEIVLKDSGLYLLTISDSSGWKNRDTINYHYYPLPQTDAGMDTSICQGDSAYLFGHGGQSFYWNTGDSSQATSIQVLSNKVLYLTSISDKACVNMDSVFIQVLQLPIANAGTDTFSCYGELITLSASGGLQYAWSNGDSLNTSTFKSIKSETLFVVVSNSDGCSSVDSLNLTVYPLPNVFGGNDTSICTNGSVEFKASGAKNYFWNTGDQTQTINVKISGDMTLTLAGTDSNSCSNYDSIHITAKKLPELNLGNDTVLCLGQSIQLTVNSNFDAWFWSTGDTVASIWIDSSKTAIDSQVVWLRVIKDQCSNVDSIYIRFDTCLSIPAQFTNSFFTIYPNPAKDWFTIEIKNDLLLSDFEISLYNVYGNEILKKKILFPYNANSSKICLESVAAGIYLIRLQNQTEVYYSKVLIR